MIRYLILLLFCTLSFSQTSFKFDYMLEYNYHNLQDSTKNRKVFYLTNSNDNSYSLEITNNDSLIYNLFFIKHDYISSHVKISKKKFESNINININCENVFPTSNPYKFQVKYYDFIKTNDSINFEEYKTVCLRSEKYIKKKKIGFHKLIFDTNSPFLLPYLFHSTLYEEWKLEKNLPNNLIVKNSFYDFNSKLVYTQELINYSKIDKKINIITTECDDFYLNEILKLKQ